MKNTKNTTFTLNEITTESGRNVASGMISIANDSRINVFSGHVSGLSHFVVFAVIDVDGNGTNGHSMSISATIHGIRQEDVSVASAEEAVEIILAKAEAAGISPMVRLSVVDSWNVNRTMQLPAAIDFGTGGKLMNSYKAGACDFTGKAFEKGAAIIWYGKTRKVRAI